jgi:formylglycine-generating enzyme required for sulfatase activity
MAKRNADRDQPTEQEIAEAQQQARTTIADKLRQWSSYAFTGGIATLTAAGAYALATGLDETALGKAAVGLGANWFSNLVWELRQKSAAKHDTRALIAETAKAIEANLSDARLAEVVDKFNLIEASLAALQHDQAQRDALIQKLLARNLATPQQVRQSANAVNVHIAESVLNNSAVIAIGGDNHGHIHINVGGGPLDLSPQIKTYRSSLALKVSALDLLAVNAQGADDPDRISLADVYTPLHAIKSVKTASNNAQFEEIPGGMAFGLGVSASISANFITLLSEHPRAVILGDPGCGKSTVLSYLALGLCGLLDSSKDFAEAWTHGPLLPLRIVLREFARSAHAAHADGLMRFAQAQLNTPETARLAEHLSDYVQTHGAAWLLDGLDEVPAGQRAGLKVQIERLVTLYPNCRCVVTCRTYSYESERQQLNPQTPHALPFEAFTVRPLTPNDMGNFVRAYFKQLGLKGRTTTPDAHARDLTAALQDRASLRRMGANPLLLSLMVLVHLDKGKLPNNRVELLKEVVDSLLSKWKKEIYEGENHPDRIHDLRIRQTIERRKDGFVQTLYAIALEAHSEMAQTATDDNDEGDEATADQVADISRELLEKHLGTFFKPELQDGLFNLENVWTYLSHRVGLLNDAGGEAKHTYKFPHRLVQEYLAAKAIDEFDRREELALPRKLDADFARWREVYALLALMNNPSHTRDCVEELCELNAAPATRQQARRAALAGQIWLDREPSEAQFASRKIADHYEQVRSLQAQLLGQTELLTARERAAVGRTVAKLRGGDPRHEVMDVDALVWRPVRVRPYTMGSDEYSDEQPRFTYTQLAQDFRMSQYPITHAQYQQFVQAKGYANRDFWGAAIAAGRWDAERGLRCDTWNGDKREYEEGWATQHQDFGEPFNLPNHPVVGVCWYEAVAFCKWLGQRLGKPVRLPTEAEWEFVARSDDARIFPWGEEADPNKANYDQTNISATSAVGCFPNGRSPFLCEEMAGTVWEWTTTKWLEDYKNYAQMESNEIDGNEDRRVVRGGSWNFNVFGVRCAYRYGVPPLDRDDDLGFRVVVGSPLFQ